VRQLNDYEPASSLIGKNAPDPLAGQRVVGEELSHPGGGFFLLPPVPVVILAQPGEDVGVEPDRKPLCFQVGDRSVVGLLLEAARVFGVDEEGGDGCGKRCGQISVVNATVASGLVGGLRDVVAAASCFRHASSASAVNLPLENYHGFSLWSSFFCS